MIGDASLRPVVRPDLGRAVAGRYHRPPGLGPFRLALLQLEFVQPRPQHAHRLVLVLELALLVLTRYHKAGGKMGDTHGRIGRIDALATRAARPVYVDLEIVRMNGQVQFLGFGQNGHRRSRRVDTAAGFGCGNPLHAVNAALVLHRPVGIGPRKTEDDLLVSALGAVRHVDELQPPALRFGVTAVQPVEITGKEARLVPARSGPDFHDGVLGIFGIPGQEFQAQLLLNTGQALVQHRKLGSRHPDQVRIVLGLEHLLEPVPFRDQLAIRIHRIDDAVQRRVLSGQLGHLPHVGRDLGRRHHAVDLGVPVENTLNDPVGNHVRSVGADNERESDGSVRAPSGGRRRQIVSRPAVGRVALSLTSNP